MQVHIVTAVLMLLFGAAFNDENSEQTKYYDDYFCYVLKPRICSAAAIVSLSTVVLDILSYVTVQSAKNRSDSRAQPGIATGQPQCPQQRTEVILGLNLLLFDWKGLKSVGRDKSFRYLLWNIEQDVVSFRSLAELMKMAYFTYSSSQNHNCWIFSSQFETN